jgi:diguanylate cyclase (GGDEF)-like protein/PAS domain S-box-containing protein
MPTAAKVIIVEDERIVAFNLQQRLAKLGYEVPAISVSSVQALHDIEKFDPDIVLMDIHIEGDVDGIDTAAVVGEKFCVPVIYLTAYSEEATLDRARATRPYGYLLKPFSERELHATIQMALERSHVEKALNDSEQRLRLAMEAANMGNWELTKNNNDKQMLYAGQADRIFGYPEQTFTGTREEFMRLVNSEDQTYVNTSIDKSIAGNAIIDIEFRSAQETSDHQWLRLQGKVLHPGKHDRLRVIGVIQNISERKQSELRLQQAATVFEATQDGIMILDLHARVIACNKSFTTMSGYESAEMLGRLPYFLQREALRRGQPAELQRVFQTGGQWRGEIQTRRKDGSELPTLTTIVAVADANHDLSHYVLVLTDLSAVRSAEKKLQYLAHHDPLTDLPNRLLTIERLQQALLRGKRHCESVAVLFIDLDHFKWINDSLGHNAGDTLLQSVAARMKTCLRTDDTIGRLGGDEFLVVLDPVDDAQNVALVAQKLIGAIGQPLTIEHNTVDVTCSIGISLFPHDGELSESLIRAADTAMYVAKERGRNCYEFFTPAMMEKAQRCLALNHDLHRGFLAEELRLYYQPQISLVTGKIVGVEALLRWQHPQKGLLGPNDIIPLAENGGMIVEIGNWVVRQASNQLRRWMDEEIPPVRVAVNVSAMQMHKRNFSAVIGEILTAANVPPGHIEIEITESTLQNEASCISTLEELRKLGVQISIDDFGTGFSCLSSLKLLPIHKVKIDRTFVRDMPNDENDVAIAEAVIAMAHKLKMAVIAEGVENWQQEKLLRERGCDEAQGFLYAKPMPVDEITRLLRDPNLNLLNNAC